MARKTRRTGNKPVTRKKEKEKLEESFIAINSAKSELASLNKEKKEQEKLIKNNESIITKLISEKKVTMNELVDIKLERTKKEKELEELFGKIKTGEIDLKFLELKKSTAKKELTKTESDRNSYINSHNEEIKKIEKELEDKIRESNDKFNEAVKTGQQVLDNILDATLFAQKEFDFAVKRLDGANKDYIKLEEGIEKLKEARQAEIDVRTEKIKREIKTKKKELDSLTRDINSDLDRQLFVARDLELLNKDKSEIIYKTRLFQDKLNSLQVETEKIKEDKNNTLKTLTEKIAEEEGKLNKIRNQRFAITKAKKDISKSYLYIKNLYEHANVPLPKIDINI